jgi:MerR family transcriptional regulator/heat shock protein HspR
MPESGRDQSPEALADEPVYVISVAAKLAGLPTWTLRVLDKEGIVRPQRTVKDRRLYSDRDIARLARVRYLTEERGVNMNGVKLILEMEEQERTPLSPPRDSETSVNEGDSS